MQVESSLVFDTIRPCTRVPYTTTQQYMVTHRAPTLVRQINHSRTRCRQARGLCINKQVAKLRYVLTLEVQTDKVSVKLGGFVIPCKGVGGVGEEQCSFRQGPTRGIKFANRRGV